MAEKFEIEGEIAVNGSFHNFDELRIWIDGQTSYLTKDEVKALVAHLTKVLEEDDKKQNQ